MDMGVEEVRAQLEGLGQVNRILCHPGGDADNLAGTEQSVADIDFTLSKDASGAEIIHIEDKGPGQTRYQDMLSRHVGRFQEITASLRAL